MDDKIILFEDFMHYPTKELNSSWIRQTGGHGYGNRELQYYTTSSKNLFIDSDGLHIKAYKEDYENNHYTSARIFSTKMFKYGRISFEIKLPSKMGTWPAIWMLGEAGTIYRSWPDCGEIDLMEFIGRMPGKVHISLHCKNFNHILNNHRTKILDLNDNNYHKFVIDWTYDGFKCMIDDKAYNLFDRPSDDSYESWPFDQNFFLIINMAIGGFFPGDPDDSFDSDEFIIRYIKVEKIDDEN